MSMLSEAITLHANSSDKQTSHMHVGKMLNDNQKYSNAQAKEWVYYTSSTWEMNLTNEQYSKVWLIGPG